MNKERQQGKSEDLSNDDDEDDDDDDDDSPRESNINTNNLNNNGDGLVTVEVPKPNETSESSSNSPTTNDEVSDIFEENKPKLAWRHNVKKTTKEPYTKWDMNEFGVKLIELTEEMKHTLPPTDSRLRKVSLFASCLCLS